MPSDREQRIADFVRPFTVGDFDPAFKSGTTSNKQLRELLRTPQ
jgi:hypothetical protein